MALAIASHCQWVLQELLLQVHISPRWNHWILNGQHKVNEVPQEQWPLRCATIDPNMTPFWPWPLQSCILQTIHQPTWSGAHVNTFFEANMENCLQAAILDHPQDTGHLSPVQVYSIPPAISLEWVSERTDLVQGSSERVFQREYSKSDQKVLFPIIQKILTTPGAHHLPSHISGKSSCRNLIKGLSMHVVWGSAGNCVLGKSMSVSLLSCCWEIDCRPLNQ